jgi:hypothetical protein
MEFRRFWRNITKFRFHENVHFFATNNSNSYKANLLVFPRISPCLTHILAKIFAQTVAPRKPLVIKYFQKILSLCSLVGDKFYFCVKILKKLTFQNFRKVFCHYFCKDFHSFRIFLQAIFSNMQNKI